MVACSNSPRLLWLALALGLVGVKAPAAPQLASVSSTTPAGGNRIAGTVVSRNDGRPLAGARVTIRDPKDFQKFEFMVTSEDGKYQFTGLPAGKYALSGGKPGFISASYDEHDRYSTAIVTGAGLDTETLVLRLAPDGVIAGKVLDEAGDPVRQATVTLYYDDHSSGVDQIRPFSSSQTDDLGEYELTPLRPGTYFLSVSGKPWYAIHPSSEPAYPDQPGEGPQMVDRSLDVAYQVTYYPDVTEADEAMPIPIRGGDRVQADFHLNPVPSLHLIFRMPDVGKNTLFVPQLQQPAFDGYTVQNPMTRRFPSGLMEVTGIPAGRYNIRLRGPGAVLQMNGVDLTRDGEEIDTSRSEAVSTVKVSLKIAGEATLPPRLAVALRSGNRLVSAYQAFDSRGEAELPPVAPGIYEVAVLGGVKPYSIAHISAEGARISEHTIAVTEGSSPSISLTVVSGNAEIRGTVTKAGKGFAGAMVVLVPKNPEVDHDLFRRDQSDLDGTFLLRGVVPGSYTILSIENGWDLDWSQPGVIAAYLKRGRKIEAGNRGGAPLNIADPIEVQSK